MDLESVLGVYFTGVSTNAVFSGQRDGAIRLMVERILTSSKSPLVAEERPTAAVAGMYPVALVEFAAPFDTDHESHDLARILLAGELGAHAFQIYFMNRTGQQALVKALNVLNRQRRATRMYFGPSRQGHVSNCFAGECLYSLIIASSPLPKTIAAA